MAPLAHSLNNEAPGVTGSEGRAVSVRLQPASCEARGLPPGGLGALPTTRGREVGDPSAGIGGCSLHSPDELLEGRLLPTRVALECGRR